MTHFSIEDDDVWARLFLALPTIKYAWARHCYRHTPTTYRFRYARLAGHSATHYYRTSALELPSRFAIIVSMHDEQYPSLFHGYCHMSSRCRLLAVTDVRHLIVSATDAMIFIAPILATTHEAAIAMKRRYYTGWPRSMHARRRSADVFAAGHLYFRVAAGNTCRQRVSHARCQCTTRRHFGIATML